MNRIEKYAFSDLYEMASGISSSKEQAGHGAPFVSFGTVYNNYFLPEELPDLMDTSEKEQETYSIHKDDILITRTSETIDELAMSCVAVKDYSGATYSGFTKRLRPKSEGIVYSKYIAFYLRGYLFRKAVTNNAFMTLRASFNEDIFSFLNLYLPEYSQQKVIGDLLYRIEEKIQINRKINDNLEQQLLMIYDYWFNQFNFPNQNSKPYNTFDGDMIYNDTLKRKIPLNWQVKSLGELCTFRNGINYDKSIVGNKQYRIINVRNITSSSLFLNENELDEICLQQVQGDKYSATEHDIIIARSGTPGSTRLIYAHNDNIIFCGFIICCTPIDEITKLYLTFYLKQLEGTSATKTGGSILQNVSQDTLKDLKVCIPPDDVLKSFNTFSCSLLN